MAGGPLNQFATGARPSFPPELTAVDTRPPSLSSFSLSRIRPSHTHLLSRVIPFPTPLPPPFGLLRSTRVRVLLVQQHIQSSSHAGRACVRACVVWYGHGVTAAPALSS